MLVIMHISISMHFWSHMQSSSPVQFGFPLLCRLVLCPACNGAALDCRLRGRARTRRALMRACRAHSSWASLQTWAHSWTYYMRQTWTSWQILCTMPRTSCGVSLVDLRLRWKVPLLSRWYAISFRHQQQATCHFPVPEQVCKQNCSVLGASSICKGLYSQAADFCAE